MNIDLYPLAWQETLRAIRAALEGQPLHLDSQSKMYLEDAAAAILEALEPEIERQHLDRSYPEGGF